MSGDNGPENDLRGTPLGLYKRGRGSNVLRTGLLQSDTPDPDTRQGLHPDHRPRLSHPLSGANLATLLRALATSGGVARERLPQAAVALGAALGRFPFTTAERLYVAATLGRNPKIQPPIFIIGHWRSGTTHLYNVMSRGGFGFVDPLAAGLPWDLLGLVPLLRPWLERALPHDRFIDSIPVTPDSPQEDELALANMTTLSYYHGLYFPKRFPEAFYRGLFFDGCGPDEIAVWQRRFRTFLAKLSHARNGQRLLIKNPVYTARVAMLHDMYPGAKFIHIHRNPHQIFASMRNFFDKLFAELALQRTGNLDIDSVILATFSRMMDRLLEEAPRLPDGAFVELAYDDLVANPLASLAEIYRRLDLPDFEAAKPSFESYLAGVRGYRTNIYGDSDDAAALVERHWGRHLRIWGYQRPVGTSRGPGRHTMATP